MDFRIIESSTPIAIGVKSSNHQILKSSNLQIEIFWSPPISNCLIFKFSNLQINKKSLRLEAYSCR